MHTLPKLYKTYASLFHTDMPHVSKCPTTPDGVEEGKKRLGCGNDKYGNNQYMCLANTEKVSLVEFCYDGIMGIQSKGNLFSI